MSSVIRDFSQEAVENIKELIKENVDEEKQFFLWDWIDDTFKMDDLNIQDYLNDVSKYQKHMVDKHNISSKKFDRILERVKAVDVNYAKRFNTIYESMLSYNNKIVKVTNMISLAGITLNSDVYDSVIDGLERIHNKDIDYLKYELEDFEDEMPQLRDIPWHEKALNGIGGTAVSLIRDNVEGLAFIPYTIVDGVFGTNLNENLQYTLDDIEDYLIDNLVTDEESYYYGKTVGNVVCMVEGAIFIANGLTTIAGGITLLGGGTALSSTGVGAIVGVPAIAVSISAVAVGTIAISSGGGIIYSSMNNFKENISKAQEAKTSKVDEAKMKDDIEELDGKLDKVDETIKGVGEAKFKYKNNPSDNPKVLINAVENPNAVYGYSPNPEPPSRIKEFASTKYDWTNPEEVAKYRKIRIKYHEANDNISELVISMKKEGASLEEIARAANNQRNQNRLNSYIKRNDFEGLAKVKASNLREYGHEDGLRFEDALKKYGSFEKIIEGAMGANPGMDACCGLYDEYFHLYKMN